MPFLMRVPSPPVPELAGVDENTQTTNQEAVPVPYVAGEAVVAMHWASPIYNQFVREAPSDQGGKK
jgi:hypothetical protein